jgi:hypothetical protein
MGGIEVRECVERPAGAVEITGEQTASISVEQRVDPDVHIAGEVAFEDLITVREVFAVGCLRVGHATANRRAPS